MRSCQLTSSFKHLSLYRMLPADTLCNVCRYWSLSYLIRLHQGDCYDDPRLYMVQLVHRLIRRLTWCDCSPAVDGMWAEWDSTATSGRVLLIDIMECDSVCVCDPGCSFLMVWFVMSICVWYGLGNGCPFLVGWHRLIWEWSSKMFSTGGLVSVDDCQDGSPVWMEWMEGRP